MRYILGLCAVLAMGNPAWTSEVGGATGEVTGGGGAVVVKWVVVVVFIIQFKFPNLFSIVRHHNSHFGDLAAKLLQLFQ